MNQAAGLRARLLPYGDAAVLVELDGPGEVLAVHAALSADPLPGTIDLVPAARTVLVIIDPARTDPARVAARLQDRLSSLDVSTGLPSHQQGDVVEIPVHYDGPDLKYVAAYTGLSRAEVIKAHGGGEWTVAFCGFAPGFGYLTGGDSRLVVPRRSAPRTRVPAGAVALADAYTAVYPTASPGGWQLLGHTTLSVWDLERDPPALLRPGVRVRFVDVDAFTSA